MYSLGTIKAGTMANKIEISSKNIKPRTNLNHSSDNNNTCFPVTRLGLSLLVWCPTWVEFVGSLLCSESISLGTPLYTVAHKGHAAN